jgi:hypothetical protein
LDIKANHLILDGVAGSVSVNCSLDMGIVCKSLSGVVELNQISATSKITIPVNVVFSTRVKGIGTSISYEKDGKPTEPFCVDNSDNIIELNGMKSELIICTSSDETFR